MPVIGIESYIINFKVLETNDTKFIVLLDTSTYLFTPEKPLVEITPPGYTGYIEFPYNPSTIITIDSNKLGLTDAASLTELQDLPDGVYQIKLKICPYNEFFYKMCYLKTTKLKTQLQDLLLKLDLNCGCMEEDKIQKEIIDIELLILSAEAETVRCNVDKATKKYSAALSKLNNLDKKLNCK